VTDLLERIGVRLPLVQAGMGGGIAGVDLAVAVTEAGGLGTLGMSSPAGLAKQLTEARLRTSGPIAVNLLLPFVRRDHARPAAEADVVVTFWGRPRRFSDKVWIHQVGSVDEAKRAHAAGADAVIVQGVEAGGHVRGTTPALVLLEQVRAALPAGFPLLLAGGIAEADDVDAALASGAEAAVCGTRFLMSEESGASAGYKRRLTDADETVLTELFGVGWPGAHRVLPNGATKRWLRADQRGPRAVRLANRLTRPVMSHGPDAAVGWVVQHQTVAVPFFTPAPPAGEVPDRVLDTSPLYAGESVARIHEISPASAIVRELTAHLGG